MNKQKLKSWSEAREELLRVSGTEACKAFDDALASGRKVTATKILRKNGIGIYDQ